MCDVLSVNHSFHLNDIYNLFGFLAGKGDQVREVEHKYLSIYFKHILCNFTQKRIGQSTDAMLKPSPTQHPHMYKCVKGQDFLPGRMV